MTSGIHMTARRLPSLWGAWRRKPPAGVPAAFWEKTKGVRLLVCACWLAVILIVIPSFVLFLFGYERAAEPLEPILGILVLAPLVLYFVPMRALRRRFCKFVASRNYLVCLECGYPLTGLPSPHDCPECGKSYNAAVVRRLWIGWCGVDELL